MEQELEQEQKVLLDMELPDPIDALIYISDDLRDRFSKIKMHTDELKLMEEYLHRWDTDPALKVLREMRPEFESDLDWFNVSKPLHLGSLHGKLVILDFFTYCCINCLHVLPDLEALETTFPVKTGLVIVGVHSPKFANEKDATNILSAAQRYNIKHPIVNDVHSMLWRSIGIRCWPSLLVLNPNGYPILLIMGEGHGKFLNWFTEQALLYYRTNGEIATFELPLTPSTSLRAASTLSFPAKITRSDNDCFAIADSGNNRILIVSKDGNVMHKVGGCDSGFVDGDFKNARFKCPQGVVFLNPNVLIVADTKNHALRKITINKGTVITLVGTGLQGNDRVGGKVAHEQELASPWDVSVFQTPDMDMSFHHEDQTVPEKTIVLVSMAGSHQIWGYFPEETIWWKFRKFEANTCVALIGNGQEENRNNSYPQNAGFAQPSGMVLAKNFLFIADSESSSIRKASMLDGKVTAVVGGDRNPLNLFAYGDVDGKLYSAKLQHPLGVAYNPLNDKVYVADTYNHKIKIIDPAINTVESLHIKNESGVLHKFNEPSGICFNSSGTFMYVADTNNHCIEMVDVEKLETKRFDIKFNSLAPETETDAPLGISKELQLIKQLPIMAKQVQLQVNVNLSEGFKFTPDAPQKWSLDIKNSQFEAVNYSGVLNGGRLSLHLKQAASFESPVVPENNIKLNFTLSLCDNRSCLMRRFSLLILNASTESDAAVPATAEALETEIDILITQTDVKLV